MLNAGLADRASVVIGFSESAKHIAQMQTPAVQTFWGSIEADLVGGTNGPDRILGVSPDQMTQGGYGSIIPQLGAQDKGDTLEGWNGDDTLEGAAGTDVLRGGEGNDVLIGGAGNDHMWGGPGADRYVYGNAAEAFADNIVMEDASDVLDFRGLGLAYRGTALFEANGTAQLRWQPQYEAGGRPWPAQVTIDSDGNGEGDAWITVYGTLADASFLL